MIYNLFPLFHVKHEGLPFYSPRKSDEGADIDLINNLCWHNGQMPFVSLPQNKQCIVSLHYKIRTRVQKKGSCLSDTFTIVLFIS